MQVILMKSSKDGQAVLVDKWVNRKGDSPIDMCGLTYFDIDRGCIDKINLTAEQYEHLDWQIGENDIQDIYFNFSLGNSPVVEFVFQVVEKGQWSRKVLTAIKGIA